MGFRNAMNYLKHVPNKNSIVALWIRMIAVFVCVSILFGVMTYSYSKKQYKQRADQAYQMLIDQVAASFDMSLRDAQTILLKFLENWRVLKLAAAEDIDSIVYSQDKMEIIKQLKAYTAINSFISDIHLHFVAHDYIVSTETLASAEIFHSAAYKADMPDFSSWYECFYSRSSGDTFVFVTNSDLIAPRYGSSNELYFMMTNANAQTEDGVQAFFSVQGSSIVKLLKNMHLDAGVSVAIVLEDGTVFVSSDYGVWDDVLEEAAFSSNAGKEMTLRTKSGSLFLKRSEHMNIYYALYAPDSANAYSTALILGLSISGVIVMLVLAVFLTIRFVVRNAEPLMEIRNMLSVGNIGKNDSELAFIRDAVRYSQQTVSDMASTLEIKKRRLQDAYLYMLLLGRDQIYSKTAILSELDFRHDHFGVIAFAMDDESYVMNREQDVFLLLQAEQHRISLLDDGVDMRYLKINDVFILLMNMDVQACAHWSDFNLKIMHALTVAWENNFDEQLLSAAGACCCGYENAADSYRQAILALRYTLLHAGDGDTHPRPDAQVLHYSFMPADDNRLANALLHESVSEISAQIDALWDENSCYEVFLEILACDIGATAMRVYQNLGLDDNGEPRMLLFLARMLSAATADRKKILMEMLAFVNAQCRIKQEDSQDRFCQEVLDYIRRHYSDPELSIDQICTIFDRSRNYIYVAFKNSTGNGLLHHINRIRLEHAKELLLLPRATVEKTAEAVGLNSALTLARIFKRFEGVSPGKYIQKHKKTAGTAAPADISTE